jgi:hypothetical protein
VGVLKRLFGTIVLFDFRRLARLRWKEAELAGPMHGCVLSWTAVGELRGVAVCSVIGHGAGHGAVTAVCCKLVARSCWSSRNICRSRKERYASGRSSKLLTPSPFVYKCHA